MAKLTTKRDYEYQCKSCREKITLRRTVDERDNEVVCENCNTEMFRKFSISHFTI